MSTLALPAVGGFHRESSVAFSANLLIALVFPRKGSERRLDRHGSKTATSESKDEMKR